MAIAIHKKFIAGVAALAICVTGVSASQANADSRDRNRALVALLGLAVVGAAIAEDRKDKRREAAALATRNKPVVVAPSARIQARPLPNRARRQANRRALPQSCLREFNTRRGAQHIFGARCLNQNYGFVSSLPRNCERQIRTTQGVRTGFSARCLNNQGYQTVRR